MLWDHLFGTFATEREHEPIVYGIRGPLASHDPVRLLAARSALVLKLQPVNLAQ
jgi:hypothetical protein